MSAFVLVIALSVGSPNIPPASLPPAPYALHTRRWRVHWYADGIGWR